MKKQKPKTKTNKQTNETQAVGDMVDLHAVF